MRAFIVAIAYFGGDKGLRGKLPPTDHSRWSLPNQELTRKAAAQVCKEAQVCTDEEDTMVRDACGVRLCTV